MEAQAPLTGLQLVPFRDVLSNVVQSAHDGLAQLAERLPGLSDEERKRQVLEHLQTTRQRLQRLHVCAQWAHKAKAVNTCREVLKAAQDHGAAFVHTADELFRLHEELRFSRAPLFDVSTALHISQTGTYRLLPRIIEDELQQPGQRLERPGELDDAARAQKRRDALRRVDFLLRSKLLTAELPAGMQVLHVRGGQATVAAAGGQYTARLTLVPAPQEDVTLAKYRPPGEPEEAAAAKEEPEVMQPAADAGPSTSAAAATEQPSTSAAAAAGTPGGAAAQRREGPDCWRWQLLSFELLPVAAGHHPPPLLPAQRVWLQQHIEQRMWVAADVQQLVRLGKQAWVTVSELPSAKEQQQQQGTPSAGVPSASAVPAPSASLAAADGKGKQPVKEEPLEQQQGAGQPRPGEAQQLLPPFATSPLAAMHGVLCQTAGRLALFSLLLSDARQLEGGSWKGGLKLSRAADGKGLRFSYWQGLPCASYAELQCLREGRGFRPEAPVAGGPAGAAAGAQQAQQQVAPAVEVVVQEDGSLAAESSPQLRHALSGEAVQLRLPLHSAASLSADRLLLEAAAHSAAMQLAAVQAALQRGGRLGAARAELSMPASASSGASGGEAPLPVSPQLHVWSGGSLQLSLSMQLRTGRLLLLAGPTLLEGGHGSDAAASVAAVQQQLDQSQRDAMSLPLPSGSSRGMLAARLAADALGRLSLQLSMRWRMLAATAAAASCGLRQAALPQQLLGAYLRQAAALLEPPSANTLTLLLPAFPPPPDMQQWARQQQQRRQGGTVDSGAMRCFLVLDFGDPAAAAVEAAEADASDTARQQAAGTSVEQALPRMLLAVCSCTARGTVTRVLQLAALPSHVLADAQAAAAGSIAAGSAALASRKRRALDAATSAAEAAQEQPAAAAAAGADIELGLGLASAAAWCRRQAGWEALRSQLMMLPVQHAEELPLGQPKRQLIRLPKAPVLAQLEAWAVAKLAAAAAAGEAPPAGPAPKPAATMQLEESAEAGSGAASSSGSAWRVDLSSAYFARLPELLRQQGVRLAAPAADAAHITQHSAGLTLRYSLAAGHSVLTTITDLVRLGMLHLCLTRMAGCMAANPLAVAAKAANSNGALLPAAGAACDGPTNGGLANGQLLHDSAGAPAGALAWPLPGCGSARLLEAGLTHLVLLVSPPPLPDGLQQLGQPAPLRLTISWDNTLASSGSSSGGSSGGSISAAPIAGPQHGGSIAAAALAAAAAATGSTASGSSSSGGASSGGGSLRHIRCRVLSEPALPEPVSTALAQQLEAGRVDLFLDSLCLAGHAAAAAALQLTPEAQHAAGLLPGALRLLGAAGASAAGSSALRLRAQLQQGGRAASLCLAFHAGGYTLLQLAPAQGGSAAAAASIWMPPLWDRLARCVPTFAAVEAPPAPAPAQQSGEPPRQPPASQQLRQAWVHHSGLGEALAQVMRAVAATAAEPR
ncbi:hypothetical protein ABPG75_002353 [Micractinium tetrahymenae]